MAYCMRMQEKNITRARVVVEQGMTPSAKQLLSDMAPKYVRIIDSLQWYTECVLVYEMTFWNVLVLVVLVYT